jgi:succinate dehydrogenase / fumarate reductase, cytochrome b subunit
MSAPATMPAERGDAPARGAWLREVWRSSVGKKVIVAITGTVLVIYVVLHVAGNLKAFQGVGADGAAIDKYAEWLRTVGEPAIPREGVLWTVRAILLACLVLHVAGVIQLAKRNRDARPAGYPAPRIQRSLAARTMLVGGLLLLAFIVFHILHFTTGTIQPSRFAEGAVYQNLDEAFSQPLFVAIYVIASLTIGLHAWHAVWSSTQTAGWDKPNRNPTFRRASSFIALALGIGFAAVPVAFWTGVMEDPPPGASESRASTEAASP